MFPYFYSCHTCRNCLAGRRNACLNLKMAMLGGRADEPPYFVGGYGDYYLLPAGAVVYSVPDTVSDDIAAGANCALSQVMYGLERVDLQLGEHVVVQGAGAWGGCTRSPSPKPAAPPMSSLSTESPSGSISQQRSAPTPCSTSTRSAHRKIARKRCVG